VVLVNSVLFVTVWYVLTICVLVTNVVFLTVWYWSQCGIC